jgi:hypothetical protein
MKEGKLKEVNGPSTWQAFRVTTLLKLFLYYLAQRVKA